MKTNEACTTVYDFKTFRESGCIKETRWWILSCENNEVVVAQWEPTNHKWYTPMHCWGREEIGADNYTLTPVHDSTSRIIHMRPVFSY